MRPIINSRKKLVLILPFFPNILQPDRVLISPENFMRCGSRPKKIFRAQLGGNEKNFPRLGASGDRLDRTVPHFVEDIETAAFRAI